MATGAELRECRQARGLSLEQASSATRIAITHLRALEDDALDRLPEGPYAEAYRRAYATWLGLEEASDAPELTLPLQQRRAPLWLVRGVSVAALVALVAFGVWQVTRTDAVARYLGASSPASETVQTEAEAVPTGQQRVRVTARRSADLRILADGQVFYDDRFREGDALEVEGTRVEVQLPAVEAATVEVDGRRVVPQGRQDRPRTLVFIDDVWGG